MVRKKYLINSCYFCKSKDLKEKKECIVSSNGAFTEIDALECQKCGETYYTMDDTEKARKELHPSFVFKLKSLFTKNMHKVEFFKGRVL